MELHCRSYLFVPGNRAERFDKAAAANADAMIIDLEDAVAPAEKSRAREAAADWIAPERPALLRINALDTTWFRDDLALCDRPGVLGVMLPKAECEADVLTVARASGRPVLPLIETAVGISHVTAIAAVPGVQRLVFGALDFQADLCIPGEGEALITFRSQIVLASRLARIAAPVDGVTPGIDDVAAITRETLYAKALGFAAKLCIHPRQVPIVHAALRPTPDELAWARRVLVAVAEGGKGALQVDGAMVDPPVLRRALSIARHDEELRPLSCKFVRMHSDESKR